MATNPYQESGSWKPPPPRSPDVNPQYVHHLTPNPPPEISHSIPKRKGVKQRCIKFTAAAVISLLLLLLVAGVLLGYYYSSPCVHGRQCGDGGCVWESQWCDGVMDCRAGQDEANCVRVHGSRFLLQIYSTQSKNWRTVCYKGWSDLHGRAGCQHIGYSKGTYFKSGPQQIDSSDGFVIVKSNYKPDESLLQQVVLSSTCPNNSAVTLLCTDCGSGVNSTRATGIQPASLGAWPWQVSLQVAGSHRCGGAIISPYWIVTTAHCVASVSTPGDWAVYAGVVESLGTLFNPSYSVSRVIAHEGYDSKTHRSDIALMKLSKPLDHTVSSNIGPVCLPNVGVNTTNNQKGWLTQFSGTINGDSGSPYLMEAEVFLMETADCNSTMVYNGRISQDMFCAKGVETSDNMCRTDSGGLLVSLKDGLWWLIGDSIWGQDCIEPNQPGVYSNITFYLDWMFQQMRKHQDD
ncbi:transmembrane protease serine 2-like [Notolabrus celidotus]|uniref:transmembrane protease serine 2-like n=1 Tax=Notolabrus celidotus TaxID=1203425 RepID=UPI00148FA801|nr:transmembrane protease serine 2-like [Notolabrus celidotus]